MRKGTVFTIQFAVEVELNSENWRNDVHSTGFFRTNRFFRLNVASPTMLDLVGVLAIQVLSTAVYLSARVSLQLLNHKGNVETQGWAFRLCCWCNGDGVVTCEGQLHRHIVLDLTIAAVE